MSDFKVVCPNCKASLRLNQALRPGQRIRCPRCSTSFGASDQVAPPPPAGFAPPVPLSGFAPHSPAPVPAPPSNRGAVLGVILGGLVLLAGASIGLAYFFANSGSGSGSGSGKKDTPLERPKDDSVVNADNANRDRRTSDGDRTNRDARLRDNGRPQDNKDIKDQDNKTRDNPNKDKDAVRDQRPRPDDTVRDKDKPKDQRPRTDGDTTQLTSLPADEQKKVNEAIDKGVAYLKSFINTYTITSSMYKVGLYALPGLTLLECGVKADDPAVQKVTALIREHAKSLDKDKALTKTYDLSTAILFLDKLGDPQDRPLIQALALRLIAGQTATGGWGYDCPLLTETESKELLIALDQTRPLSIQDLKLNISSKGGDDPKPMEEPTKGTIDFKKAKEGVSDRLKNVQVLQPPDNEMPTDDLNKAIDQRSDNSNTQFGLLGVWAAGRHKVPTDRTLALVARRFRVSQTAEGSWGYGYARGSYGTPAMNAAGLLGLAVGHGLATGAQKEDASRKKIEDPLVKKALDVLGEHLKGELGSSAEEVAKAKKAGSALKDVNNNPYFLWSVERVGVLYNVKKIGNKDWYAWGSKLIVERQLEDGSWACGGYHGNYPLIDTSFALLFLKRANFVKDLSSKLEFVIDAK